MADILVDSKITRNIDGQNQEHVLLEFERTLNRVEQAWLVEYLYDLEEYLEKIMMDLENTMNKVNKIKTIYVYLITDYAIASVG